MARDEGPNQETMNMRKMLVVFLVVAFSSSLCFAAKKPAAPVKKAVEKAVEAKIFTGKVDSVSVGNEASGVNSHILVVDDKEQLWIFTVKPYTAIIAADGGALTLDKIKKGNKVNIEYKGVKSEINESLVIHESQSVKLVE